VERILITETDHHRIKGILWVEAGTFGWKLTTLTNKEIFQGYGPVNGPNETGCSIRSELGGFTAPLLLVTTLAKHWDCDRGANSDGLLKVKQPSIKDRLSFKKTTNQQNRWTTATICQPLKSSPVNSEDQ
jgi:hypothetical protein